ncbi:MAG TPA: HlyD family efflux transporter periplasmic adaptor subunit [Bryobacteraceae bacterium]|jgi:HlyD family secretion protein|nr:HlyD family efflux transporter periplasmic adaptor subunit [Bryobacteraceae bacterium]
MKKRIVIIVLLAAAATGIWLWRSGRFSKESNRILVSGNLEMTQVDLSFRIAGRLTALNVREGDRVKKGFEIARVDPNQLEQQRARDRASVDSAQSNYQQLITTIEYQKATLESDIAAKRADLDQAKARLAELLAGSRTQEIQQAQAAVADAKARRDMAQRERDRFETLYKNEDISTSQFDQARTTLDSAAAVLRQAEQRLAMIQEGPRREEIAMQRAAVARAEAAVRTAEANRIEIRRKEQELTARRAEIDKARAQEGMSQAQLNDTSITAPMDGMVMIKSAEIGEVVAAGTTVATIADLEHPWLRAYINEPDLDRVKLGQKVKLTTDSRANKGKIYWGTVTFIASEAEFTPKQIQTKEERVKLVYRIKIEVDNTAGELKNNMPVDAEIVL